MESASSIPFRSKKPALHTTPKKPAMGSLAVDSVALETPEKSNRLRNRNVALSCKDVKKKILSLQQQELDKSDLGSSAGRSGRGSGRKEGDVQGAAIGSRSGCDRVKNTKASIRFPEKFELLCDYFNMLVAVIRLTRMRKMTPTFTNISSRFETLSGRTFTVSQLAQLKHLMPEAILVKIIRIHDEQTECMIEDLHITLDPDAFDINWSKIFRSRVEDYLKSNSEEEDVPEAEMPAVFYRPKENTKHSIVSKRSIPVVPASHVSPHFRGSILKRASSLRKVEEASSFQLIPSSLAKIPPVSAENKETDSSEGFQNESLMSPAHLPANSLLMTPTKKIISTAVTDKKKASNNIQATPLKDASTPAQLMASTPLPQGSKRPFMSPVDDKSGTPTKLIRRAQRSRSLKFDIREEEVAPTEIKQDKQVTDSDLNSALADVLPVDLLQSLKEKERKRIEELDPAISQAKRRPQVIGGLPKFFDLIRLRFLSNNRTVIPKQEFLDKTVTQNSNIREVEEQLNLMLELAPEFLSETTDSRGEILIRLNKSADAQAVRKQLQKAE